MSTNPNQNERQVLGFLGVGLDNQDGHQRLTRTENFLLFGGSQETHERMQDTAVRFTEALEKSGKRLEETPLPEVIQLLERSAEA